MNSFHRNFYSTAFFIARDIVNAEDVPLEDLNKKLNFVWENTTKELKIPLSTVEAYYLANYYKLSKTIEMRDNDGIIREITVYKLKRHLDEAYMDIRDVVRAIAHKYSIDIPFKNTNANTQSGEIVIG